MRFVVFCFIFALGVIAGGDKAQAQFRTDNPVNHANQLLDTLEKDGAKALTEALGEGLQNKDAAAGLLPILSPIEKRKAKFRGIAIDRNYGGAVRQIVVYNYMLTEQHPFIYFRFVYKMTDTGWRMSNFSVDTENSQAFPPKYGID